VISVITDNEAALKNWLESLQKASSDLQHEINQEGDMMDRHFYVIGIRSDTTRKELFSSHSLQSALVGAEEAITRNRDYFTEIIIEYREIVRRTKLGWKVEFKWEN
jgi:hypothetical protein